jgi:hypothetical protein
MPPTSGQRVADAELLWRGIRPEEIPNGRLSSGPFKYRPKFSVDVASLTSLDACFQRLSQSVAIAQFLTQTARSLDYDATHEPEQGNDAHAHAYPPKDGLRAKARRLADQCVIIERPTTPGQGS